MKHYKKYIVVALMLLIAMGSLAVKPSGITHESSMWVGDKTGSSDFTVGPNDAWIVGDFGTGGTIYNTYTKTFPIPIGAVYVDAAGLIGLATSPSILAVATDGIPCITIGASTETTSFSYSFIAEGNNFSALTFRMFYKTSQSNTSPAQFKMNWRLWVNRANTNIDAAAFDQTEVSASSTEYKTSNQVMSFVANATALAGIAAGDLVTVIWSPEDSRTVPYELYNFEIPGIEGRYSATTL